MHREVHLRAESAPAAATFLTAATSAHERLRLREALASIPSPTTRCEFGGVRYYFVDARATPRPLPGRVDHTVA